MLELRFLREDEVFHAIEPRGDFAADSPQMQGYLIAQQNCFRCHNAGAYGGSKAGISWTVLGKIATTKPAYFKAYIKEPQSESAYAEMPDFPDYDDATLAALTAYFQVIPAKAAEMTLRVAKTLLVAAVAFFYTLIVFNNTTDYGTNYQFVHHVLLMDTIFPGNQVMWRAIHPPIVQSSLLRRHYLLGIVDDGADLGRASCSYCGLSARRPADFNSAKRFSIAALTLGMLLWFVAFISVGGEWFLMWESKLWNGQEAAFRMFTVIGIVFVLLVLPDTETQP